MQERRVVITGVGAVTPLGLTAETTWKSCLAGCSGVSRIDQFDVSGYTTQVAACVKEWDPSPFLNVKEARRMDRFIQFAVGAAKMALSDSGFVINDENAGRVGVQIGSGIGGLSMIEDQHKVLLEKGPSRISPFLIPGIICNMGAGMVSIVTGAKGPSTCVTTACTTGTNNIGDAYYLIKRGAADVMLAGGAEATVTPLAMAGFCAARTMTTRNDDPEHASRPFSVDRDGFILGEGSGVMILETLESALSRNANIYAEIIGYGMSGDAYHITGQPEDGEGAARSMQNALDDAEIKPEQVGYINAHGTSTPMNDKGETRAIKTAFGEHAYKLAISSTKSMHGHLLGAAGAVEAIITAYALRDQILPPTMNLFNPDPLCDLDYIPNEARKASVDIAISNSFGFGGHNATLTLKRYQV
ncbi:MAG: beta-ketoacyl-ACP synthase II [Chthonomonadaceae bacterium]|nr:beta-ketoacyl-ACP synthase II [Chthonomonadaceae bacterium]